MSGQWATGHRRNAAGAVGRSLLLAVIALFAAGVQRASAADTGSPLEVTPESVTSEDTFALSFREPQYCPGDSNQGYLWQTFITPATTDPSSLTFEIGLPLGMGFTSGLRDPAGSWIRNNNPGLTDGLVVPPSAVSLAGPAFAGLTAGSYLLGIACTKQGADNVTRAVRFWTAPVVVRRTASGQRGGVRMEAVVDGDNVGSASAAAPAADSGPDTLTPDTLTADTGLSDLAASGDAGVESPANSAPDNALAVDTTVVAGGSTEERSGSGWSTLLWVLVLLIIARTAYLVFTRRAKGER